MYKDKKKSNYPTPQVRDSVWLIPASYMIGEFSSEFRLSGCNRNMRRPLALTLCFLLLVFAANEINLDVEGFRVSITSTQIPAYEFYLASKPSDIYGFRLWQIYEAVGGVFVSFVYST